LIKSVPPVKPYFPDEDIQQLKNCLEEILRSGMLTLHTYTKQFEKMFAEFSGTKFAIATNSGTAALEIALRCTKVREGDEILVPTNTFSATAASVFMAGGRPKLVDIDSKTLCVDVENIQRNITAKTRGIIAVHIGGLICPEIMAIKEICDDLDLFLIEDAAHAQGSRINDKYAGSLGDAGCFSFYPTKVMTTGEGGMITTDNEEWAKKAAILRDQGKESSSSELIVELGHNWRMQELSAAMGLAQLKRLPEILEKRNSIAHFYDNAFSRMSGVRPLITPAGLTNNYYKYVLILENDIDRQKLKQGLRDKGVRCGGEVYWPPLHLQPVYQRLLGTDKRDFPNAEDVCKRMICPPIYAQMLRADAEYVVEKLEETLGNI